MLCPPGLWKLLPSGKLSKPPEFHRQDCLSHWWLVISLSPSFGLSLPSEGVAEESSWVRVQPSNHALVLATRLHDSHYRDCVNCVLGAKGNRTGWTFRIWNNVKTDHLECWNDIQNVSDFTHAVWTCKVQVIWTTGQWLSLKQMSLRKVCNIISWSPHSKCELWTLKPRNSILLTIPRANHTIKRRLLLSRCTQPHKKFPSYLLLVTTTQEYTRTHYLGREVMPTLVSVSCCLAIRTVRESGGSEHPGICRKACCSPSHSKEDSLMPDSFILGSGE